MVWRSVRTALEQDTVAPPFYFLDLLAYRDVSDLIASSLGVIHESPQLILIHQGKAIYHAAHAEADYADMLQAIV
jgi:bacillithiol system protein YtxJ